MDDLANLLVVLVIVLTISASMCGVKKTASVVSSAFVRETHTGTFTKTGKGCVNLEGDLAKRYGRGRYRFCDTVTAAVLDSRRGGQELAFLFQADAGWKDTIWLNAQALRRHGTLSLTKHTVPTSFGKVSLIGGVILIAWVFIASAIEAERVRKQKQAQLEEERARTVAREAEVRVRTANIRELSSKGASELPILLNHADGWLAHAENEFRDNAFAPFWDAVEQAARNLEAFHWKVKQLTENCNEYYRLAGQLGQTDTPFSVQLNTLPDPSPILGRFRRVVRMGQRDFHFANIYEHRRTREVMIAGFRTLGEALNNLSETLVYSLDDLKGSLSSGLAQVVEEERRLRETINERASEQRARDEQQARTLSNIDRRLSSRKGT